MPGVSSLKNAGGPRLDFHQNQLVLFYYVHFQGFSAFVYTNSISILPFPTFCSLAFSPCRMRSPWHFHFLSCQLRSLPCCEWDNITLWCLLPLTQRASFVPLHTAASPTILFSGTPNCPDFGKVFPDPVHNTKRFCQKANVFCPFVSYVGDFNPLFYSG